MGKKWQIKDQGESLSTDVEVAAPHLSDIRPVIRTDFAAVTAIGGENGFNGQEGAVDGSSTGTGQLTSRSEYF